MALADFLTLGGGYTDPADILRVIDATRPPQPMDERPYNMPPGNPSGPQKDALNAAVGDMAPPRPKSSGFRSFLGALGDAISIGAGGEPLYRQRQQRQNIAAALSQYLGNTDQALSQIFEQDPATGVALLRMKQAETAPPAELKLFKYYQQLDPETRSAFDKFLQLTHPGMMSPISLPDPNAHIEYPGQGGASAKTVNTQEEYDALPPGTPYIDSQGNHAVKGGAAPSNGPLTF